MSVQSKEARGSFTKPQPPRLQKLLHSRYWQICRYLCLSLSAPAPPCAAHSPALSSSLPGAPSVSPLSSSCPNRHLPHCHPQPCHQSPAPGCSSKARSRAATPLQNTLRSRPGCQKSLLHDKSPPAPIEMRDGNSSQLPEVLLSPPATSSISATSCLCHTGTPGRGLFFCMGNFSSFEEFQLNPPADLKPTSLKLI